MIIFFPVIKIISILLWIFNICLWLKSILIYQYVLIDLQHLHLQSYCASSTFLSTKQTSEIFITNTPRHEIHLRFKSIYSIKLGGLQRKFTVHILFFVHNSHYIWGEIQFDNLEIKEGKWAVASWLVAKPTL